MAISLTNRQFAVGKSAEAIGISAGKLRNWMNKYLKRELDLGGPEGAWRKFSLVEILTLAITEELSNDNSVPLSQAYKHATYFVHRIWGLQLLLDGEIPAEALLVSRQEDSEKCTPIDEYRMILNKWEYGPNHEPGPHYNVDLLHKSEIEDHKPYRFMSVTPSRVLWRVLKSLGLVDEGNPAA